MNKPGSALLSIDVATAALGVAVATLRRWHRQGRLLPAGRTIACHRRRMAKRYATRVSSYDQSAQFKRKLHALNGNAMTPVLPMSRF